jgi:predicted anti-sigma-YlaC factor YlaD
VKCSACRARLGAYQDRELDAAAAARVEQHLHACPACRQLAETMARAECGLQQLSNLEPSEGFTRAVMARIAAQPAMAAARWRITWLGVYDLIAWLVIIGLGAAGVLRWQPVVADVGVVAGKAAVVADVLYHIAQHFHLTTLVLVGGACEIAIALMVLIAIGRSLDSATLRGVRTTS